MLIQLSSSMVIARILSPEEIGLFSIGAAMLAIAHMVRDFGIGTYIIQEKNLSKEALKAAMGLSLTVAWSIACLLFISRHSVANFYHDERLNDLIGWMSLNFIIIPIGSPILALFNREMKFNIIFWISLISSIASNAASIILAYAGYSYMSLVWSSLVNVSMTAILAAAFRPKTAFLLPSLKGSRRILSFSGKNTLANIISEIGTNTSELIIAKFLGYANVAIFSKAQTVNSMLSRDFIGSLQRVYFPLIAQTHRENGDIGYILNKSTDYIAVIAIPTYFYISLFSEEIILLLFGDKWLESAEVIKFLLISPCIYTFWRLIPPTLYAMSEAGTVLKITLYIQVIHISLLIPASTQSLLFVAYSEIITSSIAFIICSFTLHKKTKLNIFYPTTKSLTKSIFSTIFSLSIPFQLKYSILENNKNTLEILIISSTVFVVYLIISLFLFKHPLKEEITKTLKAIKKPNLWR